MILRFVKNYISQQSPKKSKSSHQTCKNKAPSNANNFKSNNSREFRLPIIDFPIFLRKIP